MNRENLDLIALKLDQAQLAEQVTGLQLLQHFELIDGFWHACVEMVTPTSEELRGLLKNNDLSSASSNGSMDQLIENGIRDQADTLTPSFCDWFDRHCSFDPKWKHESFCFHTFDRPSLLNCTVKALVSRQKRVTHNSPQQMQTKFATAVIEAMNLSADLPASEIYTDFARRGVRERMANRGQDLRAEIAFVLDIYSLFQQRFCNMSINDNAKTVRRFAVCHAQD